MANQTRARYKPSEKARELMSAMSAEDLKNSKLVWGALKAKNVKISPPTMGKLRKELLGTNGQSTADPLKRVEAILKILPSVGGMEGLEQAISIIKRVKQRA